MMNDEREPWLEELLQGGEGKMTDKQARIIAAAADLFAEKGYASSSTSEIASRAGVAEGTIFRHYKTKKDLLLTIAKPAIIKLLAPFLLREFKDVLHARYGAYEEFLRAMATNRLQFISQNKRLFKVLLQELPFHPELQQQARETLMPLVLPQLLSVIRKFQDEGSLAPLPPLTVLRLTASGIMGYILAHLVAADRNADGWDETAELEATIAFLAKGLAP
ncbi:TetR/AcrR family transcriptional regulator [Paenibacillus sp. P22]|uniref:TetR/AcrR family transcriptional regulator n=1 Tax=Paenibacillus sp. P22 TaxID=483908 RepID=UPI0003FFEA7F|nr:TetR/AcrR family transcriptional regulator [Paenibacillus sp. P22]